MNRAQELLDEVFKARRRKAPVQAAAPPLMTDKEMDDFVLGALGWRDMVMMMHWIEQGLEVSGSVRRTSHHYVHENTVTFELQVYNEDSFSEDDQAEIVQISQDAEKRVQEEVKTTSRKIYRALEKEWDWRNADEQVDEDIRANEYEFDEEGNRVVGGELQFDQLEDRAKERAREWKRQGLSEDNFWSEYIIDEWKEELEKMGFSEPDISWSGFWSQGDGASFTAKYFDLTKFAHFFMSGYADQRGHPYSDEKYEGQPPGPMGESEDFGIDMDEFVRNAVYQDFSVIAPEDPQHENWNNTAEKCYQTSHMSPDRRFFLRLTIYDTPSQGAKPGWVTVQVWASSRDERDGAKEPSLNKKTKFFVPVDDRSKLIAALLDYWQMAMRIADRRDATGHLENSRKTCRSILARLYRLAGIWNRERLEARRTHAKASLDAYHAAHPEELAKVQELARKNAERAAKEKEKLQLRADMVQWQKERDEASAAARAAGAPVSNMQIESADEELVRDVANAAVRDTVNDLGSVMTAERYMSGLTAYRWARDAAVTWRIEVIVHAGRGEEVSRQPWYVQVKVKHLHGTLTYSMDRAIPDQEKTLFGVRVHELLHKLQKIADDVWPFDDQFLLAVKAAFNEALELNPPEELYEVPPALR